MKIDKQFRILIPASLCNCLELVPNSTMKISYRQNHVLVFSKDNHDMEMVEFQASAKLDSKHRICIGKPFIEENNLMDKELSISAIAKTIIIRW